MLKYLINNYFFFFVYIVICSYIFYKNLIWLVKELDVMFVKLSKYVIINIDG